MLPVQVSRLLPVLQAASDSDQSSFEPAAFIAKDMHKIHQTFAQKNPCRLKTLPWLHYTGARSPAARSTDRNAEGIFMKGTAPAWACESASTVEAKPRNHAGTFLLEQPWGILGPYITRQLLKIHVIFQEDFLALQKSAWEAASSSFGEPKCRNAKRSMWVLQRRWQFCRFRVNQLAWQHCHP